MAIFTDRLDQTRQAERVARKGLEGKAKRQMAALGYNEYGERTGWGKVMGTLNPLGATVARAKANKIAGESDAGRFLEDTNEEYYAKKLATGKFIAQAGITALTAAGGLGALGGAGNAAGATAGTVTGTVTGTATDALAGTVADTAVSTGMNSVQDITEAGGLDLNLDDAVSVKPTMSDISSSPVADKLLKMKEESAIEDTKDQLDQDMKDASEDKTKADKELSKEQKFNKRVKQVAKVAELGMPILASGAELYASSKALKDLFLSIFALYRISSA